MQSALLTSDRSRSAGPPFSSEDSIEIVSRFVHSYGSFKRPANDSGRKQRSPIEELCPKSSTAKHAVGRRRPKRSGYGPSRSRAGGFGALRVGLLSDRGWVEPNEVTGTRHDVSHDSIHRAD
jgi:hypothetical protein